MKKLILIAAALLAVSPFAAAHDSELHRVELLGNPVDLPNADVYPMAHAILHNDVPEVRNMLTSGASVDRINNLLGVSISPLHFAAILNRTEIVELLFDHNVDMDEELNVPGFGGDATALHLAAGAGAYETIKILHRNGMNINVRTSIENPKFAGDATALHFAVAAAVLVPPGAGTNENVRIIRTIRELLDMGADVNAKVNIRGVGQGGTALHVAAHYDNKEIAEMLLANGADKNITTSDGNMTALDFATPNSTTAALIRNAAPPANGANPAPQGNGNSGGGGSGVGIAVGAVAVIGLAALLLSGGDADAFSITPNYPLINNNGFSSYSYGSRVDFQKDNWSAFWSANQAVSGGGDWIYKGELRYAKDFWDVAYKSRLRDKTATWDLTTAMQWQTGIWHWQSRINTRYQIAETDEILSAKWRNSLELDYNGWQITPAANAFWRQDNADWNLRLTAEYRF